MFNNFKIIHGYIITYFVYGSQRMKIFVKMKVGDFKLAKGGKGSDKRKERK
ncbi:hypothetical protein Hs30E_00220 [Lactococcus hodotermopsidis]|uniref:Uncharacterized protein n=1 Tax=Pseudolactococcus hodotermopsidis TaxID=2709157 RepID=A0A6A0BAI8_9LACT|nr:hypothetical protein Hs30E_00220 [Lactococcus hodotermopsidis]